MAAGSTIYIVDDDASVRRSLSRLLKTAGFDVEALPSAEEFLRCKPQRGAQCLVLDLQMPGLNGLQLQRALADADRKIPIVFISGQGDIPSSVQAMKAGAVDFLPKPFDADDFLCTIQNALAKHRVVEKKDQENKNARRLTQRLTPRENEVLSHVISGRLNKQIAYALGIREKTIKVHRGRIMKKLEAVSVVDLVRLAEKAGISPA